MTFIVSCEVIEKGGHFTLTLPIRTGTLLTSFCIASQSVDANIVSPEGATSVTITHYDNYFLFAVTCITLVSTHTLRRFRYREGKQ